MSIPHRVYVTCPKCQTRIEATVFETVNTDYAPDLAKSIIDGSLFEARCPNCGVVAHMEYDVLYNDLKHMAMIWAIHPNSRDYDKHVREARMVPTTMLTMTRIVSDMNELREKVACIESGADDRAIELYKHLFEVMINEEATESTVNQVFFTIEAGERTIIAYDDKGQERRYHLDEKIYQLLSDVAGQMSADNQQEPFPIYDRAWSRSFYASLFEEKAEIIVSEIMPEEEYDDSVAADDSKMVRFCRKCGKELLPNSRFCSYCGCEVQ